MENPRGRFWVRNYKQIPVSGLNSHFNVEDFSNFIMAPTVFGSFKRWIGWKNPLETKDPFESLVPWNQGFFSMPRLSSRCQEISRHTRQNRGNMSCDLQFLRYKLWESDLAPALEKHFGGSLTKKMHKPQMSWRLVSKHLGSKISPNTNNITKETFLLLELLYGWDFNIIQDLHLTSLNVFTLKLPVFRHLYHHSSWP